MANYDSDFSVRLATLEALGGDVTKKYDSVYAIDLAILDAIEQGGGGEGLNYNQIKNLLASSGVTEIVVNGDGESITLNYNLLNQIGQGGMDYDDVKAALAASGLTSILVLDGSGNTINMDYALLDQIGEVDFTKVQSGLTNTGVTDILFDNGSGATKVLNYDLVNQIGQGGGAGDYICVNGVDALSGITNPKDGMLAYVGGYTKSEEMRVVVTDYYGKNSFDINITWDDQTTAKLALGGQGGATITITNGYFEGGVTKYNDIRNTKDRRLPYGIEFNNGAKAVYVSQTDGSTYPTNNEFVNTFYFAKYNGSFPTITFTAGGTGGDIVTSSVTDETVSVSYNEKGFYKYSAKANKWLGYHVYLDKLSISELSAVFDDWVIYRNDLCCVTPFYVSSDRFDNLNVIYYPDRGNGNIKTPEQRDSNARFTLQCHGYLYTYATQIGFYTAVYGWNTTLQKWYYREQGQIKTLTENGVISKVAAVICNDDSSITAGGTKLGDTNYTLYNAAIKGTYSGSVFSTTVTVDATATTKNKVCTLSKSYMTSNDVYIRNNGDVVVWNQKVFIEKEANADWTVFDFRSTATNIFAVKVIDNQDNTFTVKIFKQSDVNLAWQSGQAYTWTEETDQTITIEPHLYTLRLNNGGSDKYLYRYI